MVFSLAGGILLYSKRNHDVFDTTLSFGNFENEFCFDVVAFKFGHN